MNVYAIIHMCIIMCKDSALDVLLCFGAIQFCKALMYLSFSSLIINLIGKTCLLYH